MASKIFQSILEAVLPLLVGSLSAWLIGQVVILFRGLKEKHPEIHDAILPVVQQAVFAAEQIYNSGEGKAKKTYAMNICETYMKNAGLNIDLSIVDAYIEAEVLKELNFLKTLKRAEDKVKDESDQKGEE